MNNSQGNMIVELIRAYYFTKRERPNIEQANLTNDLVAIVESARYQSVQLQFNNNGAAMVIFTIAAICFGLSFKLGEDHPYAAITFLTSVISIFIGLGLILLAGLIGHFRHCLFVKDCDIDSGFTPYLGDTGELLQRLKLDVSDFSRTSKKNGQLSYCKQGKSEVGSFDYHIYRFNWFTGSEDNRQYFARNGVWCNLFTHGPLDIWNARESKNWQHPMEYAVSPGFERQLTIREGDNMALARFLKPRVMEVLVEMAKQYQDMNVQVTADHDLFITWTGPDPFDLALENTRESNQVTGQNGHGTHRVNTDFSHTVEFRGENPTAWSPEMYDQIISKLKATQINKGPEALLAGIAEIRRYLDDNFSGHHTQNVNRADVAATTTGQ